jgi:hypothetical protein
MLADHPPIFRLGWDFVEISDTICQHGSAGALPSLCAGVDHCLSPQAVGIMYYVIVNKEKIY